MKIFPIHAFELMLDSRFETKPSINTVIGANVLRIVAIHQVDILDLVAEYQLEPLKAYPDAHTLYVDASKLSVDTISRLKKDVRTRLVQQSTSNHP